MNDHLSRIEKAIHRKAALCAEGWDVISLEACLADETSQAPAWRW